MSPRPAVSSPPGPGVRADFAGRAAEITRALGGLRNLQTVEACAITRLRIGLVEAQSIDEAALWMPEFLPSCASRRTWSSDRRERRCGRCRGHPGIARASAARRSAEMSPGPRRSD